jgi:hypothetical protein
MIHIMEIKYSQHLNHRIILRKIDHGLPRKIFQESQEKYFDMATGYFIAIKEGQKENRIQSGRWRKI